MQEESSATEKGEEILRGIAPKKEIEIPTFIFTDRSVAVLEAIVEYLKDVRFLQYHEIAEKLNRDERTIWTAYNRAKKKHKGLKPDTTESEKIPLQVLANRKYSIFEAAVKHLKEEKKLRYVQIAKLTGRNERTIWTVYNRAAKKGRGDGNE